MASFVLDFWEKLNLSRTHSDPEAQDGKNSTKSLSIILNYFLLYDLFLDKRLKSVLFSSFFFWSFFDFNKTAVAKNKTD